MDQQKVRESNETLPEVAQPILPPVKQALHEIYASRDDELDNHVFGDVPLKPLDFSHPQVRALIPSPLLSNEISKKQFYQLQLEKLRVMFDLTYAPEDFESIKMFRLNSD